MEGREHMIRNEINIMRKISQGHKNILSLVDYFETLNNRKFGQMLGRGWKNITLTFVSYGGQVYLVMDLAQGGELFDRICQKGNYFERDAANIVRTICDAVAYLHDNGIVHRGKLPWRWNKGLLANLMFMPFPPPPIDDARSEGK